MNIRNYFLELELSFDPIENDIDKINSAINSKRLLWSRGVNHPIKGIENRKKLSEIDNIKNIMLDNNLREKEALNAQNYMRKTINEKLEVFTAKGYITAKEVKSISNKYNIDIMYIKKYINVPIKNEDKTEKNESDLLDLSLLKMIDSNLKIINSSDLYEFLELSSNNSANELINKAKEINKSISMNSNKTPEVTAKSILAGICISIFKDNDIKRKYDNSLKIKKIDFIKEYLEIASSSGEIHEETVKIIIEEAIKNQLIENDIKEYIINYCKVNKIYVGFSIKNIKIKDVKYSKKSESTEEDKKLKSDKNLENKKKCFYNQLKGVGNSNGNINEGGFATIKGEWIYFNYNRELYKIKTNGSFLTKISSDDARSINVVGDWIFYLVDRTIYRVDIYGENKSEIFKDNISKFIVKDNYIYAIISKKIVKIDLENGKIITKFMGNVANEGIYILENYIYYLIKTLFGYGIIRVDLDYKDAKVITSVSKDFEFIGVDEEQNRFIIFDQNKRKEKILNESYKKSEMKYIIVNTNEFINNKNYISKYEYNSNSMISYKGDYSNFSDIKIGNEDFNTGKIDGLVLFEKNDKNGKVMCLGNMIMTFYDGKFNKLIKIERKTLDNYYCNVLNYI